MYLQVEALQGIPLFDHVSNNRKTEIPNLIKAINFYTCKPVHPLYCSFTSEVCKQSLK